MIPTVIRQALDPDCEAIAVGDTRPTRDFNYVGDTVSAFAAIGAAETVDYGVPYNAGSGVAVSIGEMIERVCALTGTNKPIVTDEGRMRPEKSEVKTLLADPRRFAEATGWASGIDLETGLARTVDWWRDRLTREGVRRDRGYLT